MDKSFMERLFDLEEQAAEEGISKQDIISDYEMRIMALQEEAEAEEEDEE